MDPDSKRRSIRAEFLNRAIDLAAQIGAEVVSIWSGILEQPIPEDQAFERLASSLTPVLEHARARSIVVGFEPEPGMFIDTMKRFARLDEMLEHPSFQLTLDLGHVHCIESESEASVVSAWAHRIVNIHVEDMKRGVHEHLMFGEGTIEFAPIFQALGSSCYNRSVNVELARHSHAAVDAVKRSAEFLRPFF